MSATNPGNLNQADGTGWEGSVRGQTDKNGHAVFEAKDGLPAQAWGVRAMVRNLQRYHLAGKRSLAQIIATWAPAGDRGNEPAKYAATVARWMGVQPDEDLALFTPDGGAILRLGRLASLIRAIATYENSHGYALPLSSILMGIALAQKRWMREEAEVA